MSTQNSIHGGNRREFARIHGLQEQEILDFSANTNPWGPPESVERLYHDSFETLKSYPDPESALLKKEVARHFPVFPENVIIGNGATELIYLIIQFLKPRSALLIEPTFLEYRRALNLHHVEIRGLLLKEKNHYSTTFAELSNAARNIDVVFLANPNNPTGVVIPRADVIAFVEEMRRRGIFVVLDEAFIDWVPEESLANYITDNASFFLIRSLTKFYSLPGIRIGYGLGAKRLIERLEKIKMTWSVNALAETLGVQVLREKEFQRRSCENLADEREFLVKELQGIEELGVFPSVTNFLLVKLKGSTKASELTELLAQEKIMVRDASNFAGLDNQFFRIAVKSRRENEALIEALRRIFQAVHA